jgi:hypothetical protein
MDPPPVCIHGVSINKKEKVIGYWGQYVLAY